MSYIRLDKAAAGMKASNGIDSLLMVLALVPTRASTHTIKQREPTRKEFVSDSSQTLFG